MRRIVAAKPTKFLTLTCLHIDSPAEQLATIRKGLPRLITALRQSHGPIEYLRMLEHCADGYPHFHLLLRAPYLPHAEIVEIWKRRTGAYIVDIRKAHGRSTAYVAKYLGKARDERSRWSRQRISVSHNFWPPLDAEGELVGWEHEPTHPTDYARAHASTQFEREWVGRYIPGPREPGDELPEELQSEEEPAWD